MVKRIKKEISLLDNGVFWTSAILILVVGLVLLFFPTQSSAVTLKLRTAILDYFGFVYSWLGIAVVVGCLYFGLSKYGNIKFGTPDEKPEFSEFTWAASLFTAGIAAAILYCCATEWTGYYAAPGLFITPYSAEAAEWANAYGLFHWTAIPWAFYVICAMPIGYSYFVRRKPILKVSEVCREFLGDRVDGWIGKAIDICFIVAIIMGAATDVGQGIPVIASSFTSLFHVNLGRFGNQVVCLVITAMFITSATLGLKKGIAKLSSINTVLALILLVLILIFGPTFFIIKMSTTGMGLFLQNFVRMTTWMDPVSGSGFPEDYTQFFWAWWMSYGPIMGMFIARISRGRSIRNVFAGSILYGSLGNALFFMIIGNYELHLQLTGAIDMVGRVFSGDGAAAIAESMAFLPHIIGIIALAIIAFVGTCFSASTYDSVTYCYAAVSLKSLKDTDAPPKWLLVTWALLLMLIPTAFLGLSEQYEALQSATIVGSVPIGFIMILEIISFVRMVKNDNYFDLIKSDDPGLLLDLQKKYQSEFNMTDDIENSSTGDNLTDQPVNRPVQRIPLYQVGAAQR